MASSPHTSSATWDPWGAPLVATEQGHMRDWWTGGSAFGTRVDRVDEDEASNSVRPEFRVSGDLPLAPDRIKVGVEPISRSDDSKVVSSSIATPTQSLTSQRCSGSDTGTVTTTAQLSSGDLVDDDDDEDVDFVAEDEELFLTEFADPNVANAAAISSKGHFTIPPTARAPVKARNVYIACLPREFTDETLRAMLSPFGNVLTCRMFTAGDRVTNTGKAYGFGLFERPEEALKAVSVLNGAQMSNAKVQAKLSRDCVVRKPRVRKVRERTVKPAQEMSHPRMPTPTVTVGTPSPSTGGRRTPPSVATPQQHAPQLVNHGPVPVLPFVQRPGQCAPSQPQPMTTPYANQASHANAPPTVPYVGLPFQPPRPAITSYGAPPMQPHVHAQHQLASAYPPQPFCHQQYPTAAYAPYLQQALHHPIQPHYNHYGQVMPSTIPAAAAGPYMYPHYAAMYSTQGAMMPHLPMPVSSAHAVPPSPYYTAPANRYATAATAPPVAFSHPHQHHHLSPQFAPSQQSHGVYPAQYHSYAPTGLASTNGSVGSLMSPSSFPNTMPYGPNAPGGGS